LKFFDLYEATYPAMKTLMHNMAKTVHGKAISDLIEIADLEQ